MDLVKAAETASAGTGMAGTGIPYLERYWAEKIASRTGRRADLPSAEDRRAELVLLAGLRLGVRETFDFLMMTEPSFGEFEEWVLAKNGGSIDGARAARLNGALGGDGAFGLETILSEPVLSEAELAFWDEQGYCVVKGAVSREACEAAVAAILEYAGMSMEDPNSWYGEGIWILLAHHPALWANRNAPRIHTAFAQIWGRRDLWMNVDVCGVNPPLRPGYTFQGTPLHWDATLAPPVRFGTQAILYLTDTAANQGAFSCVPGFHREVDAWLKEVPEGVDARAKAVQELRAIPIAGDAGDLIIWHEALPHAATANRGQSPRVVQYMNMFPSQFEITTTWR
jgi:hypothetical protein